MIFREKKYTIKTDIRRYLRNSTTQKKKKKKKKKSIRRNPKISILLYIDAISFVLTEKKKST